MIPWLFSLSVDIRSWVFPVNIYTWIKSLFTSSSSVNPRSTDENQGEASRESHGLAHPSGAVQVTFYLPPHVATTFWKVTSFCCTSQKGGCRPGHVSLPPRFPLSLNFDFLGKSGGFVAHRTLCCCRGLTFTLINQHALFFESHGYPRRWM